MPSWPFQLWPGDEQRNILENPMSSTVVHWLAALIKHIQRQEIVFAPLESQRAGMQACAASSDRDQHQLTGFCTCCAFGSLYKRLEASVSYAGRVEVERAALVTMIGGRED